MTTTATDRLSGISTSVAIKPPCKSYTATAITQFGEQTIGSVALVDGDRYLYNLSPANVLNGIWVVRESGHERAKDFDGARDVVTGTLVLVKPGTAETQWWEMTTAGAIIPGITAIEFERHVPEDVAAVLLRSDLADATSTAIGDALVAVKNADTGEVARTLHFWIKASRRNLCNFMSTTQVDDILSGTGSIDVSTPFATAVAAAAGGILELPQGRIRADNMSVPTARTFIVGQGRSTRISAPTATNNVFTISGESCEVRDLMIDSVPTRSAGWYVDFTSTANRGRLSNFYFDGFIGGARTAAVATVSIERGEMLNGIASTGIAIRVNAGFDVSIRDIICDQASQIFAGIYVTQTGDLTIEDVNMIHSGQALYLAPGAGQVIASVWANNSYFDTSTRGLYVNPVGASAAVVRCIFDECWFGGNTNQGVSFSTSGGGIVNGMDFVGCHGFGNAGDGMNIGDTGTTNVHLRGGAFAGNGGAGFSTAANVTDFSVQGVRLGNSHGFSGNAYGIFITSGAGANFSLINNDVRGNTTAGISDGATGGGKVVTGNNGYGYGSATYDPPSLADGAGATTTVTVTGSVLGDRAWATFDKDLQGITLTAWVSTAGTVSVRFQNESGGVLDLASGSLRAGIERIT